MDVKKAHSKFVEDTFRNRKFAAELFEKVLPENILKLLDMDTLKIEEDSFIDESLKGYQSDILFSVNNKNNHISQIYLLFEHKSYPDKNILFQLLGYMRQIYMKQDRPSPVIPIVLYHGKRKWNIPSAFNEIFDYNLKDELSPYLLNFKYFLVDVSKLNIEDIEFSLTMRVLLYTLKYIWDLESEEILRKLIVLARDLFFEKDKLLFIQKLLVYIYRVKDIKPVKLKEMIEENISKEKGDIAMTTAQMLEKKGKIQGKLEDARRMDAKGFSIEDIIDITDLTRDDLVREGIIEK